MSDKKIKIKFDTREDDRLTVRDRFAIAALPVVLITSDQDPINHNLARQAYALADAMLHERQRSEMK